MQKKMEAPYLLRCAACGTAYPDDGMRAVCDNEHGPALLRTQYAQVKFEVDDGALGIWRYASWLPVRRNAVRSRAQTGVFRSMRLARALGLDDLWIAFNGYWPERGAHLRTGTFKDLESCAVVARYAGENRMLVAASAGNTAAALASACAENGIPVTIVVPEFALSSIMIDGEADCVQFVSLTGDATYDDAIACARALCEHEDFLYEGGVFNVARRDGIGTTVYAALEAIGALPEYFVQAIGSGAGAIAAHEAATRLIADGRFGSTYPRLVLVQNHPATLVVDAWRAQSTTIPAASLAGHRDRARTIAAPVLSTGNPPYAVAGGLRDVLTESSGDVVSVDNAAVRAAQQLFLECEGAEIESAAGAALAGLKRAVDERAIDRDASILLHVTGGGRGRMRRDEPAVTPSRVLRVQASIERGAIEDLRMQVKSAVC